MPAGKCRPQTRISRQLFGHEPRATQELLLASQIEHPLVCPSWYAHVDMLVRACCGSSRMPMQRLGSLNSKEEDTCM